MNAASGFTVSGFTVLETIVALTVAGLIFAGTTALVDAAARAERSIADASMRSVGAANSERLLIDIVASLIPSDGADIALAGTPTLAGFRARCPRPGGWTARCRVTLSIMSDGRVRFSASGSPGFDLHLRDHGQRWLYLASAVRGGVWVERWESIVPPLAVGLVTDGDTLVFPIGVDP